MKRARAAEAILLICMSASAALAQGRGGHGGIPGAAPAQIAALAALNAKLAAPIQQVDEARVEFVATSLAQPRDDAAVQAKADALRAAELQLAHARAQAFEQLQNSADKLSPEQTAALAASAGGDRGFGGGRGGAARSSMPHVSIPQAKALLAMTAALAPQSQAVSQARAELASASIATPANIDLKTSALVAAELLLARARADALAKLQASADRLDAEQLAWLVRAGGVYGQGFTEPEPLDFNDHRGYVSLFDGVSLKGWDGNPKFWRVENGAIVGESTPQNPSGNTYIAYRDVIAKNFTLKFEMKIQGDGGSGFQYRSQTGLPWSRPISADVTANVGPVNLNWMMTGPQADFWPSRVYTGQFYSENTPMGIMAWRGEVVEGAGLGAKRLMGNIGDRTALGKLVKRNDWNQYTVIARGGTFLHIVNGRLMAVMVDDDPDSSNNQPGIFGVEIEATTKVYVRNIWLKTVGR